MNLQHADSDDYEIVQSVADMMVHVIKDGLRIASVTQQECAKARLYGDSPEQTVARALAYRRVGLLAVEDLR